MIRYALFCSAVLFNTPLRAGEKDSVYHYFLPDSVKASQFLSDIKIEGVRSSKEFRAGIQNGPVRLSLESDKKEKEIVFEFPATSTLLVAGMKTEQEKGEISWPYDWSAGETYQLLIAAASDSADNFSLYSGYIFLPREKKWKLVGTCRINGQWTLIKDPAHFHTAARREKMNAFFANAWCQRDNGSWKNLDAGNNIPPLISLAGHADSLAQREAETGRIEAAGKSGKLVNLQQREGIFYSILQEGSGKTVSVNDTVTVNYRLTLFDDGSLVDETKEKPASFPLKRLIRGWQIGVPLCKTGGKIRLVIPSDLGYSIRTRSAKIPPNSILVFDIEVLDTRSPQ